MTKLSKKLKKIHGSVKLPKKFNSKVELRKGMEEKHLINTSKKSRPN